MTQPKVALITGVTGQDGAYLAELLLDKGYEVHGIKRRARLFNTDRIDHLYQDPHVEHQRFTLHYGDLTDSTNLIRIIQQVQPDEIYNLAAMSHVAVSFETPEYTANADGMGTLRILEAIRILGLEKKTRFYQASTSELYGLVQEMPRGLRHLRVQRDPVEPREPAAQRDRLHAQDHAGAGAYFAGPTGLPAFGHPVRSARLGTCARLCADAVADAATRRNVAPDPAVLPPHRNGDLARQPGQGQARGDANDTPARNGSRDGEARPRFGAARPPDQVGRLSRI